MEFRFDAILYPKLGNQNSDAGHVKCSRGPHLVLVLTDTSAIEKRQKAPKSQMQNKQTTTLQTSIINCTALSEDNIYMYSTTLPSVVKVEKNSVVVRSNLKYQNQKSLNNSADFATKFTILCPETVSRNLLKPSSDLPNRHKN